MPSPDPEDLAALAEQLATDAARRLIDGLASERVVVGTKSSLTDLVTEMDQATEARLVEGILAARPDDGVSGEEGADRPGTSGVTWWLDPIDGTTNYLYGHPGFNVSVAAGLDGRVVAGVVVDPLHDDVFRAVAGGGATRNGRPIACRDTTHLPTALVATGFSYDPDRRRRQAEVLTRVLPEVRDLRRVGAAAVDLCWVACGRVDAYYERGLHTWDYAAGALIAAEAGAVVTDLAGGHPSREFTLAAPAGIAEDLAVLLRAAGADRA